MSAFSTVGDVFTDQEFSAPGNSLLWDLVHWRSRIVNVPVFSSCQSDLTSGVSIHMDATSLTMRCLAWDLETNLLIFRCSFIFALPICPDPAVSCVVSKHNKQDLNANMTKNVCRDDVHDRAPVHQGHVSVPFSHSSEVACEPFASVLFLITASTHGRCASSLCLLSFVFCLLSFVFCLSLSLSFSFSFSFSPTGSDRVLFSFLPYCVHLTVMTTSRTHCHFVKQARALRVPEVCVHTFLPTHFAA